MKESDVRIQVTEEKIEAYLRLLLQQGRVRTTILRYHSLLLRWYESLSADKVVLPDAASGWRAELEKKGLTERTILVNVSVVNGFLSYLQHPQAHAVWKKLSAVEPDPEVVLTRDDYRMLLITARTMGRRRPYLLIKTIVSVGIRTQEFQGLTVEGVRRGNIEVIAHGAQRTISIPEPNRTDLLAFAEERGVEAGPIFVSKDGAPLVHSLVWKEIIQI